MHRLGHVIAVVVIHDERSAALAGLAVDADDRLIFAAHVGGIDRQIRNLPIRRLGFAHVLVTFVNRVLMRTGESGEGQLASIWPALRHVHLGAALVNLADMIDMREIEHRVNALSVHIQRDGDDIEVACAFAVAEQRALDPVGARQHGEFRASHARAAVVVRMNGDDRRVTVGQMTDEVLNLVGVGVGRAHFHRVGQVENDGIFFRRAERLHDLMADIHGKIHFRAGEGLRRIFIAEVCAGLIGFGQLANQLCACNGDVDDALHVLFEDDFALEGGGGIIEMDDDVFCAAHSFERLADQMLARLHQHLNGHVVRNIMPVDQRAQNFIFRFGSGGKADFDFLEADIDQQFEEIELFLKVHRRDKRLVAVAQIDGAPGRRFFNAVVRPGAIRQRDGDERNILFAALIHVGVSPFNLKQDDGPGTKKRPQPL